MKTTGIVTLLYGLLILVGGIFGHQASGSVASLVAGLVCGILLLLLALAILKKKSWGEYGALLMVFILDGFFTYRFLTTHKFLPSGLLSLISLVILLVLALVIRRR